MDDSFYIDINLGNECNLRCDYCYEDILDERKGSLSNELLEKVFVFLDRLLAETNKNLILNMWGGEPLLHYNTVKLLLERYKDNNRITFMFYTNGILLEKYIDDLKKYKNISIQISYDFEPCNTLNRTHNKEISDNVRKSIILVDKKHIKYWVKSTMTMKDLENHLFEVYKDYEKFRDENALHFMNLLITPDTTFTGDILDYSKIEIQLKELIKYFYKNKMKRTGFAWFDFYSNLLCHTPKVGCLIDIDGFLYPCHGCSSMDKEKKKAFRSQNIMQADEEDFIKKFLQNLNDFDLFQPKGCEECKNVVCFRCNAHNTINTTYDLKGWNNKNPEIVCKLYTLISKYVYAYKNIIKEM